jgi:hypothetical protein
LGMTRWSNFTNNASGSARNHLIPPRSV